ncbi:FUN14 domain-containing protein 1 isoform X4 [Odontomachus brunneus]|uniref:FUN14 domain-containing protein 1 isoform X4 n=1 Tax=Odontomachus brunneus TaxID=486640 RepID=UPI0013F2359F|nr:FUN14 domain-containing protein 1 isoform X4 [Odontomachus brunneus]
MSGAKQRESTTATTVRTRTNPTTATVTRRSKMSTSKRGKGEESEEDCIDVSKGAKTYLEKFLGDVSKTSATKQMIIGSTTGWVTGVVTMKIGKVAACAIGGGIIIMQIAAHQGYIKINWDKVMRKAEKITDKVEEKITGEGPNLMDKVGKLWRNNSYTATSFLGGFIIGLTW